MIDDKKFPSVSRYLLRLPRGLASYPECQAKGSVLRQGVDSAPVRLDLAALPPELSALVAAPPLPTEWISEVHLNSIMLAYQDSVSPETWETWTYDRNRALFRKSLYRILFAVISPDRLFAGLTNRWGAFRRGSELRLLSLGDHGAQVEAKYPPYLHDELTMGAAAIAMRAAGDAAGGQTQTRLVDMEPSRCVIEITW
ncbi:MAG: hypothetical protein HOV80_15790 [Polyangiaceae bacterium]|nr:hypothetical protein [Polyangiaceae bacterium]